MNCDILVDIRPKLNLSKTFIMTSYEFLCLMNGTLARTEAAVKDIFPKKSPLVQVGRKIFIEISVTWEDLSKIDKMKTRLGTVKKRIILLKIKIF